MINEKSYALGANRSVIRDLFEYGRQRAAIVGAENVYDYSLGNPSIPAPDYVNLFGYIPKFGIDGKPIGSVTYKPQPYNNPTALYE